MSQETATLALLQELVRNACVNDFTADSGAEFRNVDTLCAFFATELAAGTMSVQRYEPHPGRVSAVFYVPGQDPAAEPLTLLGHIDVVPVDPQQWTTDPFAAEIREGKIYGRGTVDMLFITAAMAQVTKEIAQQGAQADLYFVALADEEARGGLGAGWFLEHAPEAFSWKNCLSETGGAHLPTADGSQATVLYVGEKGAAQRRLHVVGDAGHGSAPYNKDLATVKIGEVAARLAAHPPQVHDSELWENFIQAFRFSPEITAQLRAGTGYEHLGELAAYGDAISHLTVAQTVLRAGQAINVLPSHAWLELDIRTLPGQTQDKVDAYITAALGDLAEQVRIERLICEEATVSSTQTRLYEVLERAIRTQFPATTVVPVIAPGGSDLRFARRNGGAGYGFAVHAPARTLGAIHAQLHSHDEYLDLEDLDLTVAGYRQVVQEFLGATTA